MEDILTRAENKEYEIVKVQAYREELHLSLKEIADRLGSSADDVEKLETSE